MSEDRVDKLKARIAEFPRTPGVYLMKDTEGRVLYVGKAKDLRSRVNSYFQRGADLLNTRGPDICRMVDRVVEIDILECDSEVDAMLKEARLIKDIQPPHNVMLKDGKTFPYIEITMRDDFPGVFVTRTPRLKGSKLYGPFPSAAGIRDALNAMQKAFKFRTCELDIREGDDSRRYFRPCLLHAIHQCTAPCAALISKEEYRKDIDRLKKFLASKRSTLIRQLTSEMEVASKGLRFEEASKLRDQVKAIKSLELSGDPVEDVQPEAFFVDPRAGLEKLADLLALESPPRCMECIDIAHVQGSETVGSLVCFIDGKPFKSGYRRFKIRTVEGIDDYAAIREVISRRYQHAACGEELYPDVILIDGGLGQLHAGMEAFERMVAPCAEDGPSEGIGSRAHGGESRPRGVTLDASRKGQAPAAREERTARGTLRGAERPPVSPLDERGSQEGAARRRLVADPDAEAPLRISPPMVVSLAKREEELFIQKRTAPIRLPRSHEALRLLQQMRDEAHRFAQAYHHNLRKKRTFES